MIFAVPVTFSAADKLTPFFTKGAASASKFASAVQASFKKSTGSVSMFKQVLGGVTLGNLAANGIRRATNEIQQFIAGSKEAAVQGAALSTAYKTVFGPDASSQMAFARGEANRLGMALQGTAQSYMSIAAAAKGTAISGATVQEIFKGVSEAATALKIPSEQASGALLAISQMISKGKVSAEELRGQLGERLPGAFQIAARSMNMSTAELDKFMASGKLTAEKFLPAFAAQMRKEFGAGAEAAARDFGAIEQRFNNVRYTFQQGIGSLVLPVLTKLYAAVTPIINRMADWIDANKDLIASRVDRFVERATGFVERAIPVVKAAIGFIWDFGPAILAGALAFKTLGATLRTVDAVAKVFGATLNMSPIMIIGSIIAVAIAAFTLLASKVGGIGPAFKVVGQTIAKFFLTPINGAIDAVQALLSLVAKIPGLKNLAGGASAGLEKLQAGMNTTLTGSTSTVWDKGLNAFTDPYNRERVKVLDREAPNAAKVEGDRASWRGDMYFHNAPEGSTVKTAGSGAPSLRLNLMGVNE